MQAAGEDFRSISTYNPINPIRCIVKLGGAAITCKNELETIHEDNLRTVSEQLREAMCSQSSTGKKLGMDWSKPRGVSEIASSPVDDFRDVLSLDCSRFVVVHGAGSFGHFQASQSGVHKGGINQPLVKAGFVATRISVTTLNLEIVRALATEGIPSVGMSPYSCGWSTCNRNEDYWKSVSNYGRSNYSPNKHRELAHWCI
uniref:Aspartate/glutamate/uridylate kinase domain-containing protein n=1 Tax=Kalanchoe fedtschenkoi TaxID=63787 RepID=A0A7N0VLJ1_KALFE